MSEEIILIDKPQGITSFGVIRELRRRLGVKKMGHAGTLDPMATGLLIVGIGPGTKKLHEHTALSKVYDAGVLLGVKTDTGDITGVVIERANVPEISKTRAESVLRGLLGELELPVPIYSAVKQKGKPLYKYAREGRPVTVPLSRMVVKEATLIDLGGSHLKVRFHVGSGTYVRSLAEELGKRLGTVATLESLRRTSVGPFLVEDARSLESF